MGHVLATLNADRRPLHHRGLDYAIATFFGCCYFGLIALRRTYPVDAHTIVRRYEAACGYVPASSPAKCLFADTRHRVS